MRVVPTGETDAAGTVDGMRVPNLSDVLEAELTIRPHLPETPVLRPDMLCDTLKADVYVKCENLQPVGAFKVRGGINLMAQELGHGARPWPGVVAASTGNHGQSIAYAARMLGVPAHIYMPQGANPLKAARIRRLGAQLVETGADFDQSRLTAEEFAQREGLRYIHPAAEPLLVAGVATATLELLRRVPELDLLLVPVGAGSGAAGASIVARALNPALEVVGVQAAGAPSAHLSWQSGQLRETRRADTAAEGLATRVAYSYTIGILREYLSDFVLVSDREMESAVRLMFEACRQVAEEAGAAALAGAQSLPDRVRGRRVGIMLTGGNIATQRFLEILQRSPGGPEPDRSGPQ